MSWLHRLDREGGVERKRTSIDLVTEADRASEALCRSAVAATFPDDEFLGEEGGLISARAASSGSDVSRWRWVVDPLDGTTNFVHGVLRFCVSIGVMWGDETLVGVVHHPASRTTWSARRGRGAWCEGRRLRVTSARTLAESLLATGFPYDRATRAPELLAPARRCLEQARGLRRMGSAAMDLVDVARGSFDGFWESDLSPWDLAAGVLLVREAGGRVTGYGGAPFDLDAGHLVATNGLVHDALIALVAGR